MKRIVFVSKYDAELCEMDDRLPEENEVRVALSYSAVSAGTERALITANEDGDETCNFCFPSSSGYSGSGIITHVGRDVKALKTGDRVMVHGAGHRQFSTVVEKEVIKLPDNVQLDDAAFTVIAGFSLAAVRKAKVELGHNCLVAGLGLLGLFAVRFLKLCGALNIIAADFNPERRALAQKMGADYVLDPGDENYKGRIMEITSGKGVNSAIEVTGNPQALTQCLKCTARFGRVILLGCTRQLTQIDFYNDVHRPGIELIGAHSGARNRLESSFGNWTEMDDCRTIISYLSKGALDFHDLISEVHSPADAHEVYARLCKNQFPIGVLFDWNRI